MAKYEHIDHTGDIGLKIYGESLEELFENAATGMFSIIADLNKVRPEIKRNLYVEGGDLQQLLVNWLSELNFLFCTEGNIFCQFKVRELKENHMQAIARGEVYDPARHNVFTEIKAVTYHQLRIEREGQSWKAQVIFDL